MPILVEGKANYNKIHEHFINTLSSAEFPWYLVRATQSFPAMTHDLMCRSFEQSSGIPNSPFYGPARQLFNSICADNHITVRTVYRMALNLTFSDPSLHGDPHYDHMDFPHKNFILYLNTFDAGETFIMDEQDAIIQVIKPAQDKFAVFDGDRHAAGFCKPQQFKIVLVATFDGDVHSKEAEAA